MGSSMIALANSFSYRLAFILGVAPWAVTMAAQPSSSLCREVAAQVRHSTFESAQKALAAAIVAPEQVPPARWGPRDRVMDGRLRKALETEGALSDNRDGSIMEFEHLPDTSIYMGSVDAGTAHCQTAAFATLSRDGLGRIVPARAGYTGVCWNMHGSLARVLGLPAYVESGTVESTSADVVVRVTPWTGHDWATPCQLTVEFNYTLEMTQRFCSNAAPCRAAASIAPDIARAYVAYSARQPLPMRSLDEQTVPDFIGAAGIASGDEAQAVANAGWHVLERRQRAQYPGTPSFFGTMASIFPTFGHEAPNGVWDYSFSYANFVLFPLMLDGRLYLGAVGHNGVAWRDGSDILFAVYTAPGADQEDLVPLAGFVVERNPTVSKGTVVAEDGSAIPARP